MPWVLLRVGCPGSPPAHTRILPIAQHFKINTCRGKTKPFDVTLEMRKHKQKRLHSSKLPELKPIGLCFSLPVKLTAPPSQQASCLLPQPVGGRFWALQQPQLHPRACWEKRGVTHRESLSTFLSSLPISVCFCFLFSYFLT